MKTKFLLGLIVVLLFCGGTTRAADGELFDYPKIPDDKLTLSERCNYLVYHFWDKANLTSMFSSRQKLNNTIGDWFGFMPYATPDTIHLSIDRLIANVSKNANNTLVLARMAEQWLFSDSAEFTSEELYLPFAKAVADHKKISKGDKAHFASQVKIIESSGLGATMPDAVKFRNTDGREMRLNDVEGKTVLVVFADPSDMSSRLELVRLSADPHVKDLVASGDMTIVALNPGAASDAWISATSSFPSSWIVGTMADAKEYFDLSVFPAYFYLDRNHKVIAKNLAVDQILQGAASLNMRKKN